MGVLAMVKHGPGDDGHGTSMECLIGTQELPAHLREMKKPRGLWFAFQTVPYSSASPASSFR